MIVAITDSGSTYALDNGRLYRHATHGDNGLIATGVQTTRCWGDDGEEYPHRGHPWHIAGWITTPIVFETDTDQWARSWDEQPHTFCWDCTTPKLGITTVGGFTLRATDSITIPGERCDECGSTAD